MIEDDDSSRYLPLGIIGWYRFRQESKILYIGESDDVIPQYLSCNGHFITSCAIEQLLDSTDGKSNGHKNHILVKEYDYIICIGRIEKIYRPENLIEIFRRMLKDDGIFLMGMNNRYGIRYICGDRDPYTDHVLDGIENYQRSYSSPEDKFAGRCYSESEIRRMINDGGFVSCRMFSVFPTLESAHFLYDEDFTPNEELSNRIFPEYHYPESVYLEETKLYDGLVKEGLLHKMANAYLAECTMNGILTGISAVTSSIDRGKNRSVYTIINGNGTVIKRAAFTDGKRRLSGILKHSDDLIAHGIDVIDMKKNSDGDIVMPFISSPTGQQYLKTLARKDKAECLKAFDDFKDQILKSSEIISKDQQDGMGVVLNYGYLDMVPLNSFYVDGKFVFFDQEFRKKNCHANVIIARMIATVYAYDPSFRRVIDDNELYERYGLTKFLDKWHKEEYDFLSKLCRLKDLDGYYEKVRCKADIVNSNRQRMNYSDEDYRRIFVDIFDNADSRKLILFGSGTFARKFVDMYGSNYDIYAIIDNNKEHWGKTLGNIRICSPDILKSTSTGEYKVIICIKNYLSVMHQLDDMSVSAYSIFEPNKSYPARIKAPVCVNTQQSENVHTKKYHVGYISGTFDLFHKGHLNLLKSAKSRCDYLIVGVVSDEGVMRLKKHKPYIPFAERMEIVAACRYVDQAEEIPLESGGIEDAYRKYGFDCQFCGSDYVGNLSFVEGKKWLNERGSDLVILPYTQSTSSTKIKELIKKDLI